MEGSKTELDCNYLDETRDLVLKKETLSVYQIIW